MTPGDNPHQVRVLSDWDTIMMECSCGKILYATKENDIPFENMANPWAEHLKPQTQALIKDVLSGLSMKDIMKSILTFRGKHEEDQA